MSAMDPAMLRQVFQQMASQAPPCAARCLNGLPAATGGAAAVGIPPSSINIDTACDLVESGSAQSPSHVFCLTHDFCLPYTTIEDLLGSMFLDYASYFPRYCRDIKGASFVIADSWTHLSGVRPSASDLPPGFSPNPVLAASASAPAFASVLLGSSAISPTSTRSSSISAIATSTRADAKSTTSLLQVGSLQDNTASSSNNSGAPLGAILGGIFGGLAVLAALVAILFWLQAKHKKESYKESGRPVVALPHFDDQASFLVSQSSPNGSGLDARSGGMDMGAQAVVVVKDRSSGDFNMRGVPRANHVFTDFIQADDVILSVDAIGSSSNSIYGGTSAGSGAHSAIPLISPIIFASVVDTTRDSDDEREPELNDVETATATATMQDADSIPASEAQVDATAAQEEVSISPVRDNDRNNSLSGMALAFSSSENLLSARESLKKLSQTELSGSELDQSQKTSDTTKWTTDEVETWLKKYHATPVEVELFGDVSGWNAEQVAHWSGKVTKAEHVAKAMLKHGVMGAELPRLTRGDLMGRFGLTAGEANKIEFGLFALQRGSLPVHYEPKFVSFMQSLIFKIASWEKEAMGAPTPPSSPSPDMAPCVRGKPQGLTRPSDVFSDAPSDPMDVGGFSEGETLVLSNQALDQQPLLHELHMNPIQRPHSLREDGTASLALSGRLVGHTTSLTFSQPQPSSTPPLHSSHMSQQLPSPIESSVDDEIPLALLNLMMRPIEYMSNPITPPLDESVAGGMPLNQTHIPLPPPPFFAESTVDDEVPLALLSLRHGDGPSISQRERDSGIDPEQVPLAYYPARRPLLAAVRPRYHSVPLLSHPTQIRSDGGSHSHMHFELQYGFVEEDFDLPPPYSAF
ncbi:hypothetical protein HDU81_007860 [Chytriomyces hyalinus]|nr:hypothetical protein HDU81_007860 [Chytriomyces hyalinus]